MLLLQNPNFCDALFFLRFHYFPFSCALPSFVEHSLLSVSSNERKSERWGHCMYSVLYRKLFSLWGLTFLILDIFCAFLGVSFAFINVASFRLNFSFARFSARLKFMPEFETESLGSRSEMTLCLKCTRLPQGDEELFYVRAWWINESVVWRHRRTNPLRQLWCLKLYKIKSPRPRNWRFLRYGFTLVMFMLLNVLAYFFLCFQHAR